VDEENRENRSLSVSLIRGRRGEQREQVTYGLVLLEKDEENRENRSPTV